MFRTNLACEVHESLNSSCTGVDIQKEKMSVGEVISIEIKDEEGQMALGKRMGKYVSHEFPSILALGKNEIEEIVNVMSEKLKSIVDIGKERVLVVGLGNRKITADSLGPRTIDKVKVTRQYFKAYKKTFDEDYNEVAILAPGVMGITGIETQNIIKGVIDKINPTLIIAIDALASREMKRLCSIIQITDAGIEPGSGIGNMQGSLNEQELGIKVAAIGVPTVVDTATIVNDSIDLMKEKLNHKISVAGEVLGLLGELEDNEKMQFIKEVLSPKYNGTFVTPNDIDEQIESLSTILAKIINKAIHPGFGADDIAS